MLRQKQKLITTANTDTQGYLGAMNTCPSDSKVFGSSDSKSATEKGDYPGRAVGRAAGR